MPQPLSTTPIISVIVATRNRRESLRQFLEALRVLSDPPAWELIVANNGSTDGTQSLFARLAADLPAVIVNEETPGKSRALNRALNCARGDILLFTDDDVVPGADWLAALHKASSEYPEANVFGGRILVKSDSIPKWIMNSSNLKTILLSEQDFGNKICWFAADQYPAGPNLAVRRELLARMSCSWPVNLGPGTGIPLGDERAFLMQLSASDSRDRLYVPSSVVHHIVRGRRLNITHALVRCFLGGYAAGLIGRMGEPSSVRLKEGPLRLAWRRFCKLSSSRELICVLARALGVMAGSANPFIRVIYG